MTAVTDPLVVGLAVVLSGGALTWVAYMTKQLTDHAKWMAASAEATKYLVQLVEQHDRKLDDLIQGQAAAKTVAALRDRLQYPPAT